MNDRKFTPGPWEWQSFDGGKTIFLGTPNRGRLIVLDAFSRSSRASHGVLAATLRMSHRDSGDMGGIMKPLTAESVSSFPDAHLIAAAPELLDACRMLLTALQNCGYDCEQIRVMDAQKMAVAAITKATGSEA